MIYKKIGNKVAGTVPFIIVMGFFLVPFTMRCRGGGGAFAGGLFGGMALGSIMSNANRGDTVVVYPQQPAQDDVTDDLNQMNARLHQLEKQQHQLLQKTGAQQQQLVRDARAYEALQRENQKLKIENELLKNKAR